jgi:O-antigen ligase
MNFTNSNYNLLERSKLFLSIILIFQLFTLLLSIVVGPQILLFFLAFPILLLLKKNLFTGIPIFILLHMFIFKQSEGLTFEEVLFAFFYFGFFAYWYVQKSIVKREKIIQTNFDSFLLLYILILVVSFIPAFIFQVSLLKWFRELVPILTLLIIFPIIDLTKTKKQLLIILLSFFLLSFIIALKNLYFYQHALEQVTMLWEYASSRQSAHEPIFMTMIILCSSFLITTDKKSKKIISLFFLGFFSIALLITFSRGYWLATAIGLLIVFFLLPTQKKIQLFLFTFIFSFLTILFLQFVFEKEYINIIIALTGRLSSLENLTMDISMLNRFVESEAVWELIKQNPIIGYGLGKTYIFRPLLPRELPTWYVHNGYLYIWLKTGLIGLGALVIFYSISLKNSLQCLKVYRQSKLSSLSLGISGLLIAIGVVSITSPQFIQRDSLLILAVSIGIIEVLRRKKQIFLNSN